MLLAWSQRACIVGTNIPSGRVNIGARLEYTAKVVWCKCARGRVQWFQMDVFRLLHDSEDISLENRCLV